MSVVCLFVILAQVTSGGARNQVQFTKNSLEVVKQSVAAGKAALVDVRSEEEWKKGTIEGALFVPITSLRKGGDPKQLAKVLPTKKVLYTYCVVGMRARAAAFELEKQGYTVRALKPGYEELLKAGFKKVVPQPASKEEPASK